MFLIVPYAHRIVSPFHNSENLFDLFFRNCYNTVLTNSEVTTTYFSFTCKLHFLTAPLLFLYWAG